MGFLRIITRPDGRIFLSFHDCHEDAYGPLITKVVDELPGRLHITVPEDDEVATRRLGALGFVIHRREHKYRIPLDPMRRRHDVITATGIRLISAADADLTKLRLLDDALRNMTPGTAGWRWGEREFQEETFSDGFDPGTYQVAVDRRTNTYVGLVRVWLKASGPRFGYVGVLPEWRRTRVTYGLLATAFVELRRLGHTDVTAEIDSTNWASQAVARRAGAHQIGGTYELVRDV